MKKTLVAILVGAAVLAPTAAQADAPKSIGVTGRTVWYGELMQTIAELNRDYGVPIHDGCTDEDVCVEIQDYRKQDGHAAETVWSGSDITIKLNRKYDHRNSFYRRSVLSHEFGHVLGLDHADSCKTSMMTRIAQCGEYVIGYTEHEQGVIHERWG